MKVAESKSSGGWTETVWTGLRSGKMGGSRSLGRTKEDSPRTPEPKARVECVSCGHSRAHQAKGMCKMCYERERRRVSRRTVKECEMCGESKPHHANGLCTACYVRKRRMENRHSPVKKCSNCGEQRPHHANGRCKRCYMKRFRKQGRKADMCRSCGQFKSIEARGMCKACYLKDQRRLKDIKEAETSPNLQGLTDDNDFDSSGGVDSELSSPVKRRVKTSTSNATNKRRRRLILDGPGGILGVQSPSQSLNNRSDDSSDVHHTSCDEDALTAGEDSEDSEASSPVSNRHEQSKTSSVVKKELPALQWDRSQVEAWICQQLFPESVGASLLELTPDGHTLVYLTKEELHDKLKATNFRQRKRVWSAIEELRST